MKSVDLAQHARRPVDPYKPDVVVKPQQMVLNQPPKTETVKPMPAPVVKPAPVINTSKKEAEAPYEPPVDMPPMPHTFSDSAEREEKPQLERIRTSIERVLEAEPQPVTKPEVITEEPPLPQPPETEPVPPAWEETPVQTEAVQENSESNAQPETYIVPETERDLSRTAHKVIGEVFDTYIILEYDAQTLMFIDKHAAHERLLYEKLKRREEAAMAQTLLVPVTVTMDKNEYTAVLQNLSVFEQAGFDVEDFGSGTVLVRSAPLNLNGADIKDSVLEMAGYLEENKTDATTEHMDWLYHNIACRAAIKGGNASKKEELIALAEELEANPDVRYCPHGRPIYVMLKKRTLEKEFGRV